MPRFPRPSLALALPLALVVAAVPASAQAKSANLKGTVVGAPYAAGAATTAVPVLISKQSAKDAGLKSPSGVVILRRKRTVATPEGSVLPGRLRLGDRWKGSATISRSERKAVYSRISLKKITVYRRSKQLSTDELETLLGSIQTTLTSLGVSDAGLQSQLNSLARRSAASARALRP